MRRRPFLAALALLLALLPGCDLSTGDEKERPPRPAEKADKPAKLPNGWQTLTNRQGGFTFGTPPLWTARQNGTSTVLTSPDKQVAISISADRTDEALRIPLERFALSTAQGLAGFKDLEVKQPTRYRAKYPAAAVRATGTLRKNNVRQRLALVILRREGLAAYPVLAAANANRTPFAKQIDPVVRSLRGRPVEVTG